MCLKPAEHVRFGCKCTLERVLSLLRCSSRRVLRATTALPNASSTGSYTSCNSTHLRFKLHIICGFSYTHRAAVCIARARILDKAHYVQAPTCVLAEMRPCKEETMSKTVKSRMPTEKTSSIIVFLYHRSWRCARFAQQKLIMCSPKTKTRSRIL